MSRLEKTVWVALMAVILPPALGIIVLAVWAMFWTMFTEIVL